MAKDLCYPFARKTRLTQEFNVVNPPTNQPHGGYDFGTSDNQSNRDIHSAFDGVIIWGSDPKGGLCLAVYSEKENVTEVFWHIETRYSPSGAQVKKGHVIGLTGKSGIYAEHTHVQFNRGRSIRGTMQPETLNPQPFFDRMQLYSDMIAPPPVVVPVDPKDAKIKELTDANYQLTKDKETLSDMVVDREKKITALESSVNTEQQLKDKYLSDIAEISKLLETQYDPAIEWKGSAEIIGQHYKFDGAIATMKANALKEATTVELIALIINKLIPRKNG
jgi:murein DD-endopeptidase MepM/ murein hydrolase activator NlpD